MGQSQKPAPYAQGTHVPVEKSQVEIQTTLRKHGATQLMVGADDEKGLSFVGFTLDARQYRIMLKRRELPRQLPRSSSRRRVSVDEMRAQLEREQWRSLLLVVKAKLEIVARGDATVEQEFLAYLVLPDGSTVAQYLAPQIAEAYETGRMPPLLPSGGS